MANQEQLDILKQGVGVWNKWRQENPTIKVDFSKADFFAAKLSKAFLVEVDLRESNLKGVDLREADLRIANFNNADIRNANLFCAHLEFAHLEGANLLGANFNKANLSKAYLVRANLSKANLKQADLSSAVIGDSTFTDIDMSETHGLEKTVHVSSSAISNTTLQLSKGKISEVFLRGCGLSDWEIESAKLYTPNLSNEEINKVVYRIYDLRATQAVQISPLFISYSHSDTTFVDKLEKSLIAKGVRFWRDIHDMTAGRMETQIDRAIRQNPTVLLILSKNSMNSDWVQHEVRKVRELEKELGRDALCPIALDNGWKSSRWPQRVLEQVMEYAILDFSDWENESTFNTKFSKLLSGLEIFYKKPEK